MKISIIVPIYNVANYIENCLKSIILQNYLNIEVILVNDATPDNSMTVAEDVINELRKKYDVKIIEHKTNKGLSSARNSGVKIATGDWIFFLDSDDEITPDCFNLLTNEIIKNTSVDFVIGKMKLVGFNYDIPLTSLNNLKHDAILNDFLLQKWNLAGCNKLINRSFFIENKLWFAENLLHEDNDFSCRLAIAASSMACCYTPTYLYYRREGSITSFRKLKNYTDMCYIIKNNISNINKYTGLGKTINTNLNIYIIREIYNLIFLLVMEKNPEISSEEKIKIIKNLLQLKKESAIKCKLNINFKLKEILLSLNERIIYYLIKIYSIVK